MTRLVLLLLMIVAPSIADAACSGSSPTRTAASASTTDINDCFTAAADGDTILVPSGSATWSSLLTFPASKDITLTGAGIGSTVITCTADPCLKLRPSRTNIVGGFEFTGNSSFIVVRLDAAALGKYFRIHHNKFTKTGGSYGSIDAFGEPAVTCNESSPVHLSGLVDNNQFVDVRVFVAGTACSWGDGTAQHRLWTQTPPQGSWPEIVYVEGNTFTSTGGLINFIDVNYSGRYVLRYNTVSSGPGVSGAYAEVHGIQGSNRASQWKEIYGNTHSVGVENFFGLAFIRSGTGMIFGNRVGSSAQVMRLNNERSYSAPGGAPQCNGASNWDGNTGVAGYPCRDQIGRMKDNSLWTNSGESYTQDLVPLYFWNNYKGAGTTQYVPELHPDTETELADHIVENRDWYTEDTTFDGTTGVGVGTIASRPSTCTTGVGYWATDEGEWNSTNGVTADGRLYRCTATNTWTLSYTPYTYPHPLQGSSAPTLRLSGGARSSGGMRIN